MGADLSLRMGAAREDLPPVDLANFIGVLALMVADGVLVPGGGGT